MKKFIWILIIAVATSSCSLFKKPPMNREEVDALMAKNQSLENQIQECEAVKNQLTAANAEIQTLRSELTALQEATRGKFQVIVGAFKVPSNADDYSRTITNQGYEGKVIQGPFGFDLVTYSSHESLTEALRALDEARINVIETAWIYIRR